jgi:methionyl aminopeptidase
MSKSITYKTIDEIELLKESNRIVSLALAEVASIIRPGVNGETLDTIAEELIRDFGGIPGFKGYGGFPSTLCISPNSVVVHGIPNKVEFKEGDIVSVDCGVLKGGFYGDCAFTFGLGPLNESVQDLLKITEESLYLGIKEAIPGNRLGDIGFAIQNHTEFQNNFSVVREMVGHGIGSNLHEAPEVPNYGKRGTGIKLVPGMVIAIEPMINLGKRAIAQASDGWTIFTKDLSPSAHFEHSVAILDDGAQILSTHEFIKDSLKKNPNVMKIC